MDKCPLIAGSLSANEFLDRYEKLAAKRHVNDEQREAVLHGRGPLFVMAGPGSGKSEVIVARALKLVLVDGVHPSSVLVTTFTEKAARNLADRLTSRLSDMGFDATIEEMRIGTLHSICDRVMREFRFESYASTMLLDAVEQDFFVYSELATWIRNQPEDFWAYFSFLHPMASKQYGPSQWEKVRTLVALLNRSTEDQVDLDRLSTSDDEPLQRLADGIRTYASSLESKHRCDFANLQKRFLLFLASKQGVSFLKGSASRNIRSLQYLLVDEYQDTNPIQESIYLTLAKHCSGNITVVGDDDQALYRFRGGTVECIVQFPTRCAQECGQPPTAVQLRTNYRSVPEVTRWAEKILLAQPVMKQRGARTAKQQMASQRHAEKGYPPVSIAASAKPGEAAEVVADLIREILQRGLVDDPSQIAVLLKSARESPRNAGPICQALRSRGINVYNPRSKDFLEANEISGMLGAIATLVDAEAPATTHLRGRALTSSLTTWCTCYQQLARENAKLKGYVYDVHLELASRRFAPGTYLNVTLRDLFYRLLSIEPFRTWQELPGSTQRLGRLSAILESFASINGDKLRVDEQDNTRISGKWLRAVFYPRLLSYLSRVNLDDPEDPDQQILPGAVQVMTIHQSKGLEFPVVVVGSLDMQPRPDDATYKLEDILSPYLVHKRRKADRHDRAVQDLVRLFYVAFTRAENALILCGTHSHLKRATVAMGVSA